MEFLRLWRRFFLASAGSPPAADLGPEQRLSRVVFHQRNLRIAAGRAHWALFDPGTGGGLSCVHITGLSEPEVWEVARVVLLRRPDRKAVRGRADFEAGAAIREGLRVVRDDVPFVRHAEIAGWPVAGDDGKTRRQEIAKRLAQTADLRLPPVPSGATPRR